MHPRLIATEVIWDARQRQKAAKLRSTVYTQLSKPDHHKTVMTLQSEYTAMLYLSNIMKRSEPSGIPCFKQYPE